MAQGRRFRERVVGEENLGVRHHGISRASLQPPPIAPLTHPCDQRHLRQGQKRGQRVQAGWK